MTREEFSKIKFRAGMYVKYTAIQGGKPSEYYVASANFVEDLFGLCEPHLVDTEYGDDLLWVRCESVSDLTYKNQ